MFKKIMFWLYVAGGPLVVMVMTFEESLWPIRVPYDYLYMIVVGFLTVIISTFLMTHKRFHFSQKKIVTYLTPVIVYFVLVPFTYPFINATLDKLSLLILVCIIALFYTLITYCAVWIYTHWVSPKVISDSPLVQKTSHNSLGILKKSFKVGTLSLLVILLPMIWLSLIVYFNSELRIDYEAYRYEQNPSSENLTELAIDLINYRAYEERIHYLPLVMQDEVVLTNLYERRNETSRAELYALMGDTNLSFIIYPEDAKALVMTQYINAFLMTGNHQTYLELMTARTEQFGRGDFYYMFESNVILLNKEYKPVLSDMLNLLEQVYDAVDVNDKTLIFQRMVNIRLRQTIYFLFEDKEKDAELEALFNQLLEELIAYKDSLKDQ